MTTTTTRRARPLTARVLRGLRIAVLYSADSVEASRFDPDGAINAALWDDYNAAREWLRDQLGRRGER